MPKNNYPAARLNDLNHDPFTGKTITNLMELRGDGIPVDLEELNSRIMGYFRFCGERDLKPGIEGLCLALGCSRMTFWDWCNGTEDRGKPKGWREACLTAKQCISAFLEAAGLNGKINPVSYIFLAKNWMNYQDRSEVVTGIKKDEAHYLSADELPVLSDPPTYTDEQEVKT